MEYIYIASENNRGDVCYSRTLSGIYAYLIKAKWINKDTEIYSHDIASACTLEERFGKTKWIEAVEKMNFYTFNTIFDPYFQIRKERLIG